MGCFNECEKFKNNEPCLEFTLCDYELAEHDKKVRADAIKDVMSVLHPCATCCECDMGYFLDKCMADNCDLKWKDIIEKLEQLKSQTDTDEKEIQNVLRFKEMVKEQKE